MRMLDSNILIYAYNKAAPERKFCLPIIQRAIRGEEKTALSLISLIELYHILTERIPNPLPRYETSTLIQKLTLSINIEKIDISKEQVMRACQVAQKYRVRINDALIASAMEKNMIKEIYSHDKDLDGIEFISRVDPITM